MAHCYEANHFLLRQLKDIKVDCIESFFKSLIDLFLVDVYAKSSSGRVTRINKLNISAITAPKIEKIKTG